MRAGSPLSKRTCCSDSMQLLPPAPGCGDRRRQSADAAWRLSADWSASECLAPRSRGGQRAGGRMRCSLATERAGSLVRHRSGLIGRPRRRSCCALARGREATPTSSIAMPASRSTSQPGFGPTHPTHSRKYEADRAAHRVNTARRPRPLAASIATSAGARVYCGGLSSSRAAIVRPDRPSPS